MNKRIIVVVAAAALTTFAFGKDEGTGWSSSFASSLQKAKDEYRPLVLVWGNYGCSYCDTLHTALSTTDSVAWTKSRKNDYVFCFKKGTGTSDAKKAFDFAEKYMASKTGYPYVCLYWPKEDGKTQKVAFTGRQGNLNAIAASKGITLPGTSIDDDFRAFVDGFLKEYLEGDVLAFETADIATDRYEALASTLFVDVAVLRRTDVDKATAARLTATFPGVETPVEIPLEWTTGQERQLVRVDMRPAGFTFAADTKVVLRLYNSKGRKQAVGNIHLTDEAKLENSPANPLWIGERDEATNPLQAGEWTMDYDLVLKRAKDRGKNALVLVGGSQWCPDCVNTDEYLINTEVFRQWARDNDVSCAAIDVPRLHEGLSVPCLLSQQPYVKVNAEGVVTKILSGAAYVTRKMLTDDPEKLAEVLSRNLDLTTNSTENAGLCRPECQPTDWAVNPETGPFKTGIPCLIMMDPNGRIIGRLYQFNNVSPTNDTAAANYVQRLKELAALAGDKTEEVNRNWSTLDASCELEHDGGEVTSDISAIDTIDCWSLTGERATSKDLSITLTADVEDGLVLDVLSVDAQGTVRVVKSVDGDASVGLTAVVRASAALKYCVRISVDAQSEAFRLDREGDSRVAYTLSCEATDEPGAPEFAASAAAAGEKGGTRIVYVAVNRVGGASGELTVPVTVDGNRSTAQTDRYELLTETLSWADGDDAEKSVAIRIIDDDNEDGDEELCLVCGESSFTLTLIDNDTENRGMLGVSAPLYAAEGSVVEIKGIRRGGASGAGSAKLKASAGTFVDSNVMTWDDRESGEKVCRVTLPSINEAETVKFSFVNRVGMDRDEEAKSVTVTLVRADAPGFAESDIRCSATRYVAMKEKLALVNLKGASPSCEVVSGELPPGVLATIKSGRVVLQGTPSSSGDYEAVLRVSEKRNGKTVRGLTANVRCSVLSVAKLDSTDPGANPAVFESPTRTFDSVMVVDADSKRLRGVLKVTVPKSGKVSAKYLCLSGSVSFSATSWSSYDPKNGDLVAIPKTDTEGFSLQVRAVRDGTLSLALTDGDAGATFDVTASPQWDGSAENKATDWRGLYTLEFSGASLVAGDGAAAAFGNATAVLDMNEKSRWKSGLMNYVVYMPNGKSVSGSTTLARDPYDVRQVQIPIYARADDAVGVLAAVPRLMWKRTEQAISDSLDVIPAFVHVDSRDPASYELAYGMTAGSVWDKEADLSANAVEAFGSNRLVFETDGLIDEAGIKVNANSLSVSGDNPNGIAITLQKSTGRVTGSFEFISGGEVKTATFRGVVLPDWGGCANCGGRPYVSGACWYSDTFRYTISGGAEKTRTVKRGIPFAVEIPQL